MYGEAGGSEIDGVGLYHAVRGLFFLLCDGVSIEMCRNCHLVAVSHDVVHLSADDAEKRLKIADAAVQHIFNMGAVTAITAAADKDELAGPGQKLPHLLIGIRSFPNKRILRNNLCLPACKLLYLDKREKNFLLTDIISDIIIVRN